MVAAHRSARTPLFFPVDFCIISRCVRDPVPDVVAHLSLSGVCGTGGVQAAGL